MDEDAPTPIYVDEQADAVLVTVGDETTRFPDLPAARRHAIGLARTHAPSVIVAGPPGTATAEDLPPEDRPAPPTSGDDRAPSARRPSPPPARRPALPTIGTLPARPGPPALGRSLLVGPGQDVPAPWAGCPVVEVTDRSLGTDALLEAVRAAHLARQATVFVVADGLDAPEPATTSEPFWSLPPDHDLFAEDTWELMVRNAVDLRSGAPTWPLLDAAVALGATIPADGEGDVLLPDGTAGVLDAGGLDLSLDLGDLCVVPAESIALGHLRPLRAEPLTSELDKSQRRAVAEPIMRSRIIAPAGSGKTRVLTERARHLVACGVPPEAIVMVAFNRRAREEMEDRTRDLPGLRISTLNALANAIVNGADGFARRGDRLATLDEMGVRDLLSSMLTFPRRANADPAASWIEALSSIRLGLRSPAEVEAEYGGDVEGLAAFLPRWRQALADRRQVDFDEQVALAVEALLTEPEVRATARRVVGVLLVDEYQDLNPAHMLLLRLLAGPALPIFGVGDDDQTIYGYSGATPQWLVRFDHYIPGSTHHALSTNYRCPVPVVAAASNLLTHNRFRVPKQIEAGPHAADGPTAMVVAAVDDPVAETVRLVRAALDAGAAPREVCVLTRVNALLAPVEVALREQGIAVTNRDAGNLLSRTGARAALAWFALATSGTLTEAAVRDAARRPSRGLSPKVIDWMAEQGSVDGLRRLASRLSDDRSADKVAGFAADLERMVARAARSSAPELLEAIRTELGLDQSLAALDAAKQGRNAAAHSDDLRALVALGRLHPEAATFLPWVRQALGQRSDAEGVSLSTIHKVKGLEWPHVVVHDASGGVIPHRLSTDVEEERRVFHVAITRASRTLAIVADASDPSLFLAELDAPAPARPDAPAADEPSAASSRTASAREGVAAEVGLRFAWGGYDCSVTSIEESAVTVSIGTSSLSIPFGSAIAVDGRSTVLDPAGSRPSARGPGRTRTGPSVPSGPVDEGVLAALTAWRLERSRADGVPAYVVANNKTLEAIAAAMPADERTLLAVAGMGPTRLELYGDEILAVLDQARS